MNENINIVKPDPILWNLKLDVDALNLSVANLKRQETQNNYSTSELYDGIDNCKARLDSIDMVIENLQSYNKQRESITATEKNVS